MINWLVTELQAVTTPSRQARFALDLSSDQVTLIERTAKGRRELLQTGVDAHDFDERIDEMRERATRRGAGAVVDLLLPDELTLFRIDNFPAESRRNLRDETWWRLDSLTPYRPEDLCYDVALLGVDPRTGFLEVHIAVAPREIVEDAVELTRGWGFDPQRISAAKPGIGFPVGPLFLQASDRRAESRSLRRSAAGLAAAAALLAALGLLRGGAERQALAEAAETRRIGIEAELQGALATREQALALAAVAVQPAELRRGRRLTVDWLNALAEALPPKTVASRIVIDVEKLRIEGVTERADAVLAAIELADEFQGARYAEPVRDVGGPAPQRFAIEALLTPRTATEPGAPAAARP